MRVYRYPSFVSGAQSVEFVGTSVRARAKLELTLDRDGGRLVVILKNPSQADEGISDHTVNNVANYVYHNLPCIRHICIYNVFAAYETRSACLVDIMKCWGEGALKGEGTLSLEDHDCGTILDDLMKQDLCQASKVILAWGKHPPYLSTIYRRRIEEILKVVVKAGKGERMYYVHCVGKSGYPLHAQVWSTKYKMHEAVADGYRVIKRAEQACSVDDEGLANRS